MRHYSKKYEYLVPKVKEYCKDINNQKKSFKEIGSHFNISADEISSMISLNNIQYIGCKRRNIIISENDIIDIKNKYLSGLNTVEIAKVYKVNAARIYQILAKQNVKFRDNNFHTIKFKTDNNEDYNLEEILKHHNIKYKDFNKIDEIFKKHNIIYKIVFKNEFLFFEFICPICKKQSLKAPLSIKKGIFMCNDCVTKNKSDILSGKCISSLNTSGYIGITIRKSNNGNVIGYKAILKYKHKSLLNVVFKDETISNKTLMEAVVEREKFIIRNGLPHTRNLNDGELFSNMEMLGQYSDLDLIKNDLKEYYKILKLDKGI